MENQHNRGPQTLLIAACLVWLGTLVGAHALAPARTVESLWPGFATFVVPASHPVETVEEVLSAAGILEYIGFHTVRLSFNDFGSLSTVRLSELEQRFDSRDPRLDPYMRSVANYFVTHDEQASYHILYIPGDAEPVQQQIAGTAEQRGVELRSADIGAGHATRYLALPVALCVGIAALFARRRAPFVVAAGLPLVVAVERTQDPLGAAAGLLVFVVWVMSNRSLVAALGPGLVSGALRVPGSRHRVGLGAVLIYLASGLVAAGIVVLRYSPAALPSVVLVLGSVTAVTVGTVALERRRITLREHGVFEPVSILPARLRVRRVSREVFLAPACAALMLLFIPLAGSPATLDLPPLPQPVTALGLVERYASNNVELPHEGRTLPTLEEYLAHRAFQQAFMYGREFQGPVRGDQVTIPEFVRTNGRIERRDRVAFSFDDDWVEAELSALERNAHLGIEAMLLAAGSPNGVEYRMVRHVYWARSELIRTLIPLALFVLLPLSLNLGVLFPTFEPGDRVTRWLHKRRKIEAV